MGPICYFNRWKWIQRISDLFQITNKLVARIWAPDSKSRLWSLRCDERMFFLERKLLVKKKRSGSPWFLVSNKEQRAISFQFYISQKVLGLGFMSFRRGGAPEYHWIWQQHLSHLEFSITLCNCNWDTVSLKLTLGNGWFKSTEDGSQKHGNVTNSNPTWNQYLKHAQMILLWQRHCICINP